VVALVIGYYWESKLLLWPNGELNWFRTLHFYAMGWNLNEDALTYGSKTTFQIYADSAEPTNLGPNVRRLRWFSGLSRRKCKS